MDLFKFSGFLLYNYSLQPPAYLHVSHPIIIQTLASLKLDEVIHRSTCRNLLSYCSHSRKHLYIFLRLVEEEIMPLEFPKLEVLELLLLWSLSEFPAWMLVPSTLRCLTSYFTSNFPSVKELWWDRPFF